MSSADACDRLADSPGRLASPPRRRLGSFDFGFRLASPPRRRLGSYYHSNRDSTGKPARRRAHVLIRAIVKRSVREARIRRGMRMKLPPERTFRTAVTMPKAFLGRRKRSMNDGS